MVDLQNLAHLIRQGDGRFEADPLLDAQAGTDAYREILQTKKPRHEGRGFDTWADYGMGGRNRPRSDV